MNDLQSEIDKLQQDISQLEDAWKQVDEVDTGLGTDIENAGRQLVSLLDRTRRQSPNLNPAHTDALRHSASDLTEALDYYAGLPEHDTAASTDVIDKLGPGHTLLRCRPATTRPGARGGHRDQQRDT